MPPVPAPFGSGGPVQCSKEGAYVVVPHPSSSIVLYRPKRGTALPGGRKASLTSALVVKKGSHRDPIHTSRKLPENLQKTYRKLPENWTASERPPAVSPPAARSAGAGDTKSNHCVNCAAGH